MTTRPLTPLSILPASLLALSTLSCSDLHDTVAATPTTATFSGIPLAIGVVIDDAGWQRGDDSSPLGPYRLGTDRAPTLNDYHDIITAARRVGTRIPLACVMSELDRSNICAKPHYNVPRAPSDMTESGLAWDNSDNVTQGNRDLMDLMYSSAAHVQLGVHGVRHEHCLNGTLTRGEFAHIDYATTSVDSWGAEHQRLKLECCSELLRQYYDASQSSCPRMFVPPQYMYYYRPSGSGTTGASLHRFGVKYATGNTGILSPGDLGSGFIDNGVLFTSRLNFVVEWYRVGAIPEYYPYEESDYNWIEFHLPNWWKAGELWERHLTGINGRPHRYVARNSVDSYSQWLYRHYCATRHTRGTYEIDNRNMVTDAYRYGLRSTVTLKTKLYGKHVSHAAIDGNAQILGYYEDDFDYGYLVIGDGSNPMGRLERVNYTLVCELGDEYLPAYVDWTGATFNVYSLDVGASSATMSIEMYGTQTVRVALPFVPTSVRSDSADVTIGTWRAVHGYVEIEVTGRDMQGAVATLSLDG